VWIDSNDSFMSGCYLHCSGMGLVLAGSVNTIINTHVSTNWGWLPNEGVLLFSTGIYTREGWVGGGALSFTPLLRLKRSTGSPLGCPLSYRLAL
jgi:hypothetical protein